MPLRCEIRTRDHIVIECKELSERTLGKEIRLSDRMPDGIISEVVATICKDENFPIAIQFPGTGEIQSGQRVFTHVK